MLFIRIALIIANILSCPQILLAHDFTYSGINYSIHASKKVTVVSGDIPYSGDIIIPSTVLYEGTEYEVSIISDEAFNNCSELRSITIPGSIDTIYCNAFKGANSLRRVVFLDAVERLLIYYSYIDNNYSSLFFDCPIKEITLDREIDWGPGQYNDKNYSPFYKKGELESISFGPHIKKLEKTIFWNDTIQNVTIPSNITYIGKNAFGSIKNLYISDSNDRLIIETDTEVSPKYVFGFDLETLYIGRNWILSCDTLVNSSYYYHEYQPFSKQSKLISVEFGPSVSKLNDYSFYQCNYLKNFVIPNSITEIGSYAFSGCCGIEDIIIPNNVQFLGNGAFSGDTLLHKISFESSSKILSLGTTIFLNCPIDSMFLGRDLLCTRDQESPLRNNNHLVSLVFGDSITKINDYLFSNCSNIHTVVIPNNITSIGDHSFDGCTTLSKLIIEDSEQALTLGYTYYDSGNAIFGDCPLNELYIGRNINSKNNASFRNKTNLSKLTFGKYVTTLYKYEFSGSNGVKELIIPSNITTIEDYAFHNCNTLRSIIVKDCVTPISIGSCGDDGMFYYSPLDSIYIGRNIIYAGKRGERTSYANGSTIKTKTCTAPFSLQKNLSNVTISDSVSVLGSYFLYGCNDLKGINIPNSLRNLGMYAFDDCNNLITVDFDGNLADWCTINFENLYSNPCYKSHSLYINHVNLNKLKIPNSITSINDYCFAGITDITEASISGVVSIGKYAFYGCTNLLNLDIQNGVLHIGDFAFAYCSNLNEVSIPQSVLSIGNYSFSNCNQLKKIALTYGIQTINNNAFNGCIRLDSITIPESMDSINSYVFSGCTNLSKLSLPKSLKVIDSYAFMGCNGLEQIIIPQNVTNISDASFLKCINLKDVICLPSTPPSITVNQTMRDAGYNINSFPDSIHIYTLYPNEYIASEWNSYGSTIQKLAELNDTVFDYAGRVPDLIISDNGANLVFNIKPDTLYDVGMHEAHVYATSSKLLDTIQFNVQYSILPVELNIYVEDTCKYYGDANPHFIIYANGLIKGETIECLGPNLLAYTDATANSIPGTYNVFVKGGNSNNYNLNYIGGKLTIVKSPLEIICLDTIRLYGDKDPTFRYIISGLKNEDTEQSLNGSLSFLVNADQSSPVGNYSVIPTGLLSDNYLITFTEGRLSVNKAPLTITADNYTTKQCNDLPILTATYTGFKNGEDESVMLKKPEITCNATPTSDPGDYIISISKSEALNYEITQVNGVLTMERSYFILRYYLDSILYCADTVGFKMPILPHATLAKEGYTFSGWSVIPDTMPAHDVLVTGTFSVNSYFLTYKVDTSIFNVDTLNYATVITPLAAPTKEGYTFSGWSEIPATMPANDVEVTGTFNINSYVITYMLDEAVYKRDTLVYLAEITSFAAPAKEGYTFSGWSEIPATMPAKNVEVTGTFKINSYILTYKVDGETYKIDTLNYATAITPLASPTKEGYTFSGWSEIPATMPANDVEVTGTFNINSYVITYKLDGAVYKRDTLHYATAITPHAAPNKEGYTFSGWSEIPAIMPVNDVEVTGTFKINSYILTYKVDGATIKIDTLNYATVITPLDAPTKEGYTFSGWSEEPTSMPANDVEVTGTFSINAYLLIYKVDGVVYHSDTIDFTVAVTPLADPTKEGYTFSGWSEIPATMPANDVEVTGTFSINKYLLTVLIDGETAFSDSIVFGTLLRDYIEYITKLGIDLSQWEWYCQIETISMPAYDVIINAVRDAVLSIGADLDKTAIYDLIGNKISTDHISTLPPGIYIRNGHKYIIK